MYVLTDVCAYMATTKNAQEPTLLPRGGWHEGLMMLSQ